MSWDLQAPLKVEYCGSIQPYLLASMASSLSLCLPLAWQDQRSLEELDFTVVYAPSVEELPATGDGLATHPSASAVSCSYSCVWHLPSSLGRIWGELPPQKPRASGLQHRPQLGRTPVSHPAGPSPSVDPRPLGPLCFRQVHSALCEVLASPAR